MKGHNPEVKESIRWAEQIAEGVVVMMHNFFFFLMITYFPTCTGMHYLHGLRIFHRNLKPSNGNVLYGN